MKKIGLILTVLVLATFLTSCKEPNQTFLVSAICFENENGEIKATAEYISVLDTDAESGYTAKTTSATGEDVEIVLNRLSSGESKPLFYSHCATVLLAKNLNPYQIDGIFSYLKKGEIPFSAYLVAVENNNILGAKTDSTPSVGFALSSLLKNKTENFGFWDSVKVFEIITARKQKENIYALPFVLMEDEKLKAEKSLIYLNDLPKRLLNTTESIFYAMARNIYSGGRIEIENNLKTLKATRLIKVDEQTYKINLSNPLVLKELENFINQLQIEGINLLQTDKSISLVGEDE